RSHSGFLSWQSNLSNDHCFGVRNETQQARSHDFHFADTTATRFRSPPPSIALRSTQDRAKCSPGCFRGRRFRWRRDDATWVIAERNALSRSCFRAKRRATEKMERCPAGQRISCGLKTKLILRDVRIDFVRPFGDSAFEIKH